MLARGDGSCWRATVGRAGTARVHPAHADPGHRHPVHGPRTAEDGHSAHHSPLWTGSPVPTPWASACVPQSSLIQAVYVLFIWEDCTPSSKHLRSQHPIIQTSGDLAPHHLNIWGPCTPSPKHLGELHPIIQTSGGHAPHHPNIWGNCTPSSKHLGACIPSFKQLGSLYLTLLDIGIVMLVPGLNSPSSESVCLSVSLDFWGCEPLLGVSG